MQHLPFEFYIVENNGPRNTLLDSIEQARVFYTHTNTNPALEKKGMKEFNDIMLLADKYEFEDEDIIIKMTGRYTLESIHFLECIINEKDDYDAFIKWMNVCTHETDYIKWINVSARETEEYDCILGLFALRYKYLEEFNYIEMLNHPSMEYIFAKHVRETVSRHRLRDIDHLGMYFGGDKSQIF